MNLFDFQLAIAKAINDLSGYATLIELARIRGDLSTWLPQYQAGGATCGAELQKLQEITIMDTPEEVPSPECPEGYYWNGRQCLRQCPWPTLTTYERECF